VSIINGTPGDDILSGTSGDDIISGGAGNDRIDGGSGSDIWDRIYGEAGDDTLIARSDSHDILDGGPGIDTVVLDYAWLPSTWIMPGGSLGTVNLPYVSVTNVEYAQFTNKTVALFGPYLITLSRSFGNTQIPSFDLLSELVYFKSDLSGLPITRYQLYDGNSDPNSGHFMINGVAQSAGMVITITAAEAAQTSFVTGTVNDQLQIRAFDGTYWSAADNELWAPFKIMPAANHVPIMTTEDVHATSNQVFALSSLFSVSDFEYDAITQYQLFDASPDPASGHLVVNGVVQSAETVIDLTSTQLAQAYFVAGTDIDSLLIRAYDGSDWSAPSGSNNRFWSSINVIPPIRPIILLS